jgi:hypothetical protein
MTLLLAIIAQRGRASVVQTQAEAWLFLERLTGLEQAWRDELERARAARQAPIVRDRASIVRACVAGALAPDEAVTLFRRAQE